MTNEDTNKKLLSFLARESEKEDKDKVLRQLQLFLQDQEDGDIDLEGKEKIKPLKKLYANFAQKHDFKEGMLVQWKEKLKNRRRPKYKEPAIVIQFIKENPPLNSEDPGTPLFREPLDLVLGLLDDDGELLIYHFDSRRFEPYE